MTFSLKQLEHHVLIWAEKQPHIRTILVVGSQARQNNPGDEWADLDLMLFATDYTNYLISTRWLDEIGQVWVILPHQTGAGDPELLVLFDGGHKVDFVFYHITELQHLAKVSTLPNVYRRGYYILLDKDGLAAQISPPAFRPSEGQPPSEEEFLLAVNTFWYGAIYVAKQIRRRNLWVVKFRDGEMKERYLLKMMEWHARIIHGWDYNTWYGGKFLSQWIDPPTWQTLHNIFGHFDAADSWQALLATMGLFRHLAAETAARLGYHYPSALDERITQYVDRLYKEDDLLPPAL